MNRWKIKLPVIRSKERAQSLVETALFLPILIFMLLGIVEVSNLLITQNRVTTASRMGAGFGAANFDHENWADDPAGTAYDMGIVALNTITESMPLDADQWDIFSAHGLTTQDGSDYELFESLRVYGLQAVVDNTEWATMEADLKAQILDSLQSECESDPAACAGNVEFVVSVPFHNTHTILGLPVWQWVGFQRIRGFTVMRIRPVVQAQGCAILPIAVRLQQYSIYPTNWTPGYYLQYPDDPVALFPEEDDFNLPNKDHENNNRTPDPAPTYINLATTPHLDPNNFEESYPGIPLWQAISEPDIYGGATGGTLFWARDFGLGGNFGWLSWDGDVSEPAMERALVPGPPGEFEELYPDSRADEGLEYDPPFTTSDGEDTGNGDDWIQPGEWIEGTTGNIRSLVRALYYPYVKEQWEVAILVFTDIDEGTGSNLLYEAYDFITVRIVGFDFTSNDKWIVFEFISDELVCGSG